MDEISSDTRRLRPRYPAAESPLNGTDFCGPIVSDQLQQQPVVKKLAGIDACRS
jgi:hypothetical protein